MGRIGRTKRKQAMEKAVAVACAGFVCLLLIPRFGRAEVLKETDETERGYLKSTNPNYTTLVGWQLVPNPHPNNKYMDKEITGTVKNNSPREFSEIKIEFVVYDREGDQIAIVSSKSYNLKPGSIWKFNIPVTEDVERAEFKGLYVPAHRA